MLKATVNTQTFDIQLNNTEISVNSQPFKWDMVEIKDGNFHILYNNRSFNAEVLEADYQTKSFLISCPLILILSLKSFKCGEVYNPTL